MAKVPVYRGKFGVAQAERLLWRAGFGPTPGQVRKLARRNLKSAVQTLTRPKGESKLRGPEPLDSAGLPIAPFDAIFHDVLWFLDRMVRSNHPLQERMALIWHDWFATANVNSQRLNVEQAQLFERRWLDSFLDLLLDVTSNGAMLIWLDGIYNIHTAPNENYAREMMELFTLGASNSDGYPYSETDVREQARALTGWRATFLGDHEPTNFRFDPARHDPGAKTIFGQTASFDWAGSCRLCVGHPAHKTFFVTKLWSYFIPTPPSKKTRKALERLYIKRNYSVRAVVEAILMHPDLYRGPAMVKPPLVYIAGLLRARGARVQDEEWGALTKHAGQMPFKPPNVSGWNDGRWLDTSTFQGRWDAAREIAERHLINKDGPYPDEDPKTAVDRALAFWSNPGIRPATRRELERYAAAVAQSAPPKQGSTYRAMRQNALRMLIATCPEMQTC